MAVRETTGHAIVAGNNYGQGSSRENAALAPRYLGLAVVLARSFARIHWQNLVNFGILPLTFIDPADYDQLRQGDTIQLKGVRKALQSGPELMAALAGNGRTIALRHDLSPRQLALLLGGGVINWLRERLTPNAAADEDAGRAPVIGPG
jgi:aconitate hydratase